MTGSCSNEPGASEADEVGDASEANDGRPVSAGSTDDSQPVRSSAPCPKRCRRAVQKRVVTMPISEAKGGGEGAPPPDSWTWRKYGQKPIKGSPYPRGYYRCSSSKGCPARKQVERSRVDPAVIVVTYSFEHNHTWPVPRNHHHKHAAARPEEQLGQSGGKPNPGLHQRPLRRFLTRPTSAVAIVAAVEASAFASQGVFHKPVVNGGEVLSVPQNCWCWVQSKNRGRRSSAVSEAGLQP